MKHTMTRMKVKTRRIGKFEKMAILARPDALLSLFEAHLDQLSVGKRPARAVFGKLLLVGAGTLIAGAIPEAVLVELPGSEGQTVVNASADVALMARRPEELHHFVTHSLRITSRAR